MMFRPIRSVGHLACFCNRDVDNLFLEKQCSAQNGVKSVAFSMAMMGTPFCAYIYSHHSVSSILNPEGCERITG